MKKLFLIIVLTSSLAACFGKGPQSPRTNADGPRCGISTEPTGPLPAYCN